MEERRYRWRISAIGTGKGCGAISQPAAEPRLWRWGGLSPRFEQLPLRRPPDSARGLLKRGTASCALTGLTAACEQVIAHRTGRSTNLDKPLASLDSRTAVAAVYHAAKGLALLSGRTGRRVAPSAVRARDQAVRHLAATFETGAGQSRKSLSRQAPRWSGESTAARWAPDRINAIGISDRWGWAAQQLPHPTGESLPVAPQEKPDNHRGHRCRAACTPEAAGRPRILGPGTFAQGPRNGRSSHRKRLRRAEDQADCQIAPRLRIPPDTAEWPTEQGTALSW